LPGIFGVNDFINYLDSFLKVVEKRIHEPLSYFEYFELLDEIELIFINLADENITDELSQIKTQLQHKQTYLEKNNQSIVAEWVQRIRTENRSPSNFRPKFMNFTQQFPIDDLRDKAGYDAFDIFIEELLDVDYLPEETKPRTAEMVFYQPTPARVILEMLSKVEFKKTDSFYDIGSGLGRVVLLVRLLTEAQAIGVEYEPTYVSYAQRAAQKLNLSNVRFLNGDARDFDYADGTIFFFFTPFSGTIFNTVIQKLFAVAQQKPITICSYGKVTLKLMQQNWLSPLDSQDGDEYKLGIFRSKPSAE
jgi:hypothetical protein